MDQKLQSFNFFTRVNLQEKSPLTGNNAHLMNNIDMSSVIVLGSKLYIISKKTHLIYIAEITTETPQGFRTIGSFTPYTEKLEFVEKLTINGPQGRQHFLVTCGVDVEQTQGQAPGQGLRSTYVKFWEHNENVTAADLENLNCRKVLVGKISSPIPDCTHFAISADLSAFALGQKDTVLLYRSKNVMTDGIKDSSLSIEKGPLKYLGFAYDQNTNNTGIYAATSTTILSFPNIQKEAKKRLAQSGQGAFKHFDVNQKGELYCVTDTNSILAFNLFDKINEWPYEEDKQMIKCYGTNYLIAAIRVRRDEEIIGHRLIIYDLANQLFGYNPSTDVFTGVSDIFVAENNTIYAVVSNAKGDKIVYKLIEEENAKKLEKILTKNCFDIAYRFAANQQYDPSLLAEISLCNANHHYAKKDYQKAINEYKKTAGTTQPSSVIMKFLDVSQIDYLIQYLEHIHEKKLANKDHIALLLNCYVKQKNMKKFEEFLNKLPTLSSDIFDTQAAVKECRDLKHIDLALKLALQCNHEDLYIRILIEDKKDYIRALEQIRATRSLENKIRYIREYGQVFMKNEPARTLDLIKKMVILSTYRKIRFSERPLNSDEREIFEYLNLSENDKDRLGQIAFPRPDEFFHFFVVQNNYLEDYLDFLRNNKALLNEKNEKLVYPIFHKMFEYYLEQYADYFNKNAETLKWRTTADETLARFENNITNLLEAHELEKKFDKNHILVLFKMYKFGPGIVSLCEKMGLREELLDYYIERGDFGKTIELCKDHGDSEINLWVQALKYFSTLSKERRSYTDERGETRSMITDALTYIQRIDSLSPLLVLNILRNAKDLSMGEIKGYFRKKLEENTMDALRSFTMVREHTENTEKSRAEYKKLKTQAKIFQSESCSACGDKINLHENEASVYFLCGHSYHQTCLAETDKPHYECPRCAPDLNTKQEIVEDLKAKAGKTNQFFEKLEGSKNKFDVISEFMGKGLFGTFEMTSDEHDDDR